MASEKPKRDIADFFRPYAKPDSPKSIPAKRPSPSPADEHNGSQPSAGKHLKRTEPRTPLTTKRFKEAFSPYKSPFGPRSGASVTIPIRTPKPSISEDSPESLTPSSSVLRKGGLFTSASKTNDQQQTSLSFADIPIAGQSIVKDGKVTAVRSSDDEDSDSLCSLDDILGRNRHDVPTASSSPPDVGEENLEAERARSLSVFTNGRSSALIGRDKLRLLTSKANELNFDISSLVGDHFDDEEIEANVTKAKKGYKASDDQERLKRQGLMDKNLLASVMGQENKGENLQRLFNAVERTEALATEHTWTMFDSKPMSADSLPTESFPEKDVNSDPWFECLGEPNVRHRAYLSGYVAEKAAEGRISDDAVTWTFKNISHEPRDDLRKSYVRVVKAASPIWTSKNLTSSMIEKFFCQLGADSTMVKCNSSINPERQVHAKHSAPRNTRLLSAIEVLVAMSVDMTSEALSLFVALTMRLAIDTDLMSNSRVCIAVEDALSSLIDHNEERVSIVAGQCILEDMSLRVKDPHLQTLALKHILPTSSTAASLRIRLANLFSLGVTEDNTSILDFSTASGISSPDISLTQLTSHLRNPRYNVSRSSRQDPAFDYSTLSASVYIFDTAVANGGRPTIFPDTSSERAFNHHVDILGERVKSIITSIADTGASHMRRTEAKEALNALHFRLLYSVRTKPKPKKSVFGGRDGAEYRAEERSAGMMQQFLDRRKEQKGLQKERDGDAGAGAGAGGDPGSLSQKSESEELIRRQLGLQS
jgi:hypothetical protein